jgi:hypothetical protein
LVSATPPAPRLPVSIGFPEGHPGIGRDLLKRSGLVNNDEQVENHPALGAFPQSHPEIRAELHDHPTHFMQREARYQRTG